MNRPRRSILAACVVLAAALPQALAGCGESPSSTADGAATTPVTTAGGLSFSVPKAWVVQPTTPMRQAFYKVTKAEGDPEDAEFVASAFGIGQGGTVEANLERWATQFQAPGGGSASETAKTATREVGGLKVTTLDLSGTFVAAIPPAMVEKHNKPGFRMLAAVIETGSGLCFLKLVGPERTISRNEKAFSAVVDSFRFQSKEPGR